MTGKERLKMMLLKRSPALYNALLRITGPAIR